MVRVTGRTSYTVTMTSVFLFLWTRQYLLYSSRILRVSKLLSRAVVLEYLLVLQDYSSTFLEYSYSRSKYSYSYLYSNVKVVGLEQKLGPNTRVHYETYRITIKKNYLSHAFLNLC